MAEAKHSSCLRLRTSERNATGFLSVYQDGQRFVAKAGSNRLGTFSTALEAAERVAWSLVGRSQLMLGGMLRRVAAVCKRKILELNAALRAKRMPPPCGQQPTYAWQSRHAVYASRSAVVELSVASHVERTPPPRGQRPKCARYIVPRTLQLHPGEE